MSLGEAGPVPLLRLLANDARWRILRELSRSDRKVQELVDIVGQPSNLVSYHLAQLRKAHLVVERRSEADARDVYYSLDGERLIRQVSRSVAELHPAFASIEDWSLSDGPAPAWPPGTVPLPRRLLFVCSKNSARSQMAEAIARELSHGPLRFLSHGPVDAWSAGSEPTALHPMTVEALSDLGIPMTGQRSKHLDELAGLRFDYVISLCDLTREACPTFRGEPELLHWSIPDPTLVEGSDDRVRRAFTDTALAITVRVRQLLAHIGQERSAAGGAAG